MDKIDILLGCLCGYLFLRKKDAQHDSERETKKHIDEQKEEIEQKQQEIDEAGIQTEKEVITEEGVFDIDIKGYSDIWKERSSPDGLNASQLELYSMFLRQSFILIIENKTGKPIKVKKLKLCCNSVQYSNLTNTEHKFIDPFDLHNSITPMFLVYSWGGKMVSLTMGSVFSSFDECRDKGYYDNRTVTDSDSVYMTIDAYSKVSIPFFIAVYENDYSISSGAAQGKLLIESLNLTKYPFYPIVWLECMIEQPSGGTGVYKEFKVDTGFEIKFGYEN